MIHLFGKTYNKYDVMIFILIISQISGHYFGTISPISFFVLLFSPHLFNSLQAKSNEFVRPFLRFFVLWGIYNFCSLLWVPLLMRSLSFCFLFFINILMFLEILVFSKKASVPHDTIAYGWLFAFFLTSIVGIWELRTGNHLSVAKEHLSRENTAIEGAIGSYTSVTFYNINTYAIYILEVIPFLFYSIFCKTSMAIKFLAFYCVLIAFVFVLIDGSRGASISIALMLIISLYMYFFKNERKKNAILTFMILVLFVFLFYTYGEAIFSLILYRMEMNGFEDNSRMVLYQKSLELIINSLGIGTGVGSMVPAMEAQGNQYNIYYSHNMFLEFLMQYGLLIFLGFLCFLYKIFVMARKREIASKVVLYSALVSLPFFSIINSEYTHVHFVWCYFAVLFVFSSPRYFIDKSVVKN